jgi:two-component system cell cycle response regulator
MVNGFDSKPASATVMTQSNCKAFVLKEHELWELSEQSHEFTSNLLQLVVERLRSFSSQLDQYKDNSKNMQKKAYLDASTGLFNRTWLKEKAPQIINHYRQQATPLSFIMTDIDHFKTVNDSHGHDVGDLVLKQVALILQSVSKKRAYTIRLGGDEMCVILPEVELKEAIKLTNRIRLEIEEANFKFSDNQSLKVTSSFGVSSHIQNMTIKELMKQADIALYEAKETGRNKVVSFEAISAGAA